MSSAVIPVVCLVLALVAAVSEAAIALLSYRGKLPGNRYVGVRTAETYKRESVWVSANRVTAPLRAVAVAALLFTAVLCGATTGWWALLPLSAGSVAAFLFIGMAGAFGARTAAILHAREEAKDAASQEAAGCCGGAASAGSADAGACGGATGVVRDAGTTTYAGGEADPSADCGVEGGCGSCGLQGMCESDGKPLSAPAS